MDMQRFTKIQAVKEGVRMRKLRGFLSILGIIVTLIMGGFLAHISNILYRNQRVRVFMNEDKVFIDLLNEIQNNLNYIWIVWGILLIVISMQFVIFLKNFNSK
jgi:hypothetical protein